MKTTKRLLAFLLSLVICAGALFSLASCQIPGNEQNSDSESQGESETDTIPVADYTLNLVTEGKTDYVIVVPTDEELFTQDMLDAVNTLIAAFENYTGAEIEYTDDFVGWDKEPDDAAYEILIGATNRKQSAAAVDGMGFSEYVIKADGNKLVINGVGHSAIISAINYFVTHMIKDNRDLKYGDKAGTLVYKTENDYHKQSQYFIKTIKLLGEDLANCQIVYPEGGYAEEYFATLLKKHIITYSGITVDVVSDKKATADKAILIGKTNRTTVSPEAGKYIVEVTDKGLEVVSNDIFSYIAINVRFQTEIFKYSEANIDLQKGQKWDGVSMAPANLKNDSDVRIMYHNVWGYLNKDQVANPNPIATRLKIATAVYAEYAPDVIGFQEMRTGREDIETWLKANGYAEKVDYSGNPIWYNTNTLECLASGSKKAQGHGYNTMWCIFKVKATGKVFGVTNSHFTANSMVAEGQGDVEREMDAQALLDAVAAIKSHELGGENIPIFTGGDYNTTVANTPYQKLIDGGLTSTRDVATVTANNSCFHNAYTYDENYGIFLMPAAPSASADAAIDHIMIGGNKDAVTVDEYAVISDTLTASTSDHAPQFVDFSFK